ncbi:pilus assembly protein [Salmonella enterica subsp. enterica serovar Muenchen]|uniref:GspE/PulE family protein n=1 Tax=Salmonella enterica TaxID=28901 RepID=UPI0008FC237E|nr:ATPase, T2SS/T4P/T4SS family [Salmonella enterica]EAA9119170.1 pilus assembly protein [Salmonella enterica subsp. enterica serovar Oranienburg]EDV3219601.1 pilus assembly protein [Salmonella enterica subsp. enterica serovar Gaminara]EDW4627531.1 pilus assembly protein [Salmonella enterica subsp. enterica serovar Javiana]EAM4466839.1 pilus assembly protein [Salmonella enterica subsp. enterica serovar Oranienburg]EAM6359534.1 pilus assembly protein [Salmonella enterica]
MSEHNEAVLLYHNPETTAHELLVDSQRRTDVAVQQRVMSLMEENPGVTMRLVTRSELLRYSEMARQLSEQGEKGLRLEDIKKEVSRRQGDVLNYFMVAKEIGASDIHGTTLPGLTRIEMRVHGELETIAELAEEDGNAQAATIILSMCDVTDPQFYPGQKQDGRVAAKFLRKVGLFGARYSHTPTADGLHFVMRVIPDDGDVVPTLEKLGYLPEQIRLIKRILRIPEGMVILSGPTGSGKSTTLRACSDLYLKRTRYKKRLLTVEDPPEGRIVGGIQTPILCDKADEAEVRRAWERALSSALRLDPDAILPGELRDLISILAGIFAAQTGHLVLTTLHANSAFSIPERMITMGANAGLVADAQLLIGLISQRLVQVLCPHCRVPWSVKKDQLTPEEREYLEKYCSVEGICQPENLHFRNEAGCPACRKAVVIGGKQVATVGQGVAGRNVVAEVVRPDTMLFRLLIQKGKEAAKAYWLSELGGITRRIHLLHKLNAGLVDPLDADLIVPLDEDEVTLSVSNQVTSSTDIDTALIERLALVIAASVREGLKLGVEDAIKAGITAGMAALKEVA